MTRAERWALLTCRSAARFRFDEGRPGKPSKREAREEQEAVEAARLGRIPWGTYSCLANESPPLVTWDNGWRLTEAGRSALEAK